MISEKKRKVLELFEEGRKYYKLMDFSKAKVLFMEALKIDPEDGPSEIYRDRCDYYIKSPPGKDWDGVFVMTSK